MNNQQLMQSTIRGLKFSSAHIFKNVAALEQKKKKKCSVAWRIDSRERSGAPQSKGQADTTTVAHTQNKTDRCYSSPHIKLLHLLRLM